MGRPGTEARLKGGLDIGDYLTSVGPATTVTATMHSNNKQIRNIVSMFM